MTSVMRLILTPSARTNYIVEVVKCTVYESQAACR